MCTSDEALGLIGLVAGSKLVIGPRSEEGCGGGGAYRYPLYCSGCRALVGHGYPPDISKVRQVDGCFDRRRDHRFDDVSSSDSPSLGRFPGRSHPFAGLWR